MINIFITQLHAWQSDKRDSEYGYMKIVSDLSKVGILNLRVFLLIWVDQVRLTKNSF